MKKEERVLLLIDELVCVEAAKILEDVFRLESLSVSVGILPRLLQKDFPEKIRCSVMMSDVIILAASQSWYQAPTRRDAKYQHGKRVIECYNLTKDMLKDGALCVDYDELGMFTREFFKQFKAGCSIDIRTRVGSHFISRIRYVFEETGFYDRPGSGGNLPAGEISLGLLEKSGEGEIVFDVSFDHLGRLEKSPLGISIRENRITRVEGRFKEKFECLLMQNDNLRNVAEIGIGTNSAAILGRSVLEDEKKLGTVHIGFGNDTYFGGITGGPHFDGVLLNATVSVDEKLLMKDGCLV
ncbi:MAG: hypothetical protein GY797_17625 [Deltaproteobacteria bacterium]|nr:hypothetical protein [Deltaproteobacteria bacterium]